MHKQNGCRVGAQYAVGISSTDRICVAEITEYRQCANNIIKSQWAEQYAIALVMPLIHGDFRPNDFDERSGARLMAGLSADMLPGLVGDQQPIVVPQDIFETALGSLGRKEIVFPSIRSVGRNASAVRRDVKCRLPVVIPNA